MNLGETMRNVIGLMLALGLASVAQAGVEGGLRAAKAGNYAEAYNQWIGEANKGNAEAQNNIGVLFEKGLGRPADQAKAKEWYLKAAKGGNASAQNNLGVL